MRRLSLGFYLTGAAAKNELPAAAILVLRKNPERIIFHQLREM